jgi:hypothetical protein
MHRKEWCLDDYIITDKLYKGYASMGEQQAAAGVFAAAGTAHQQQLYVCGVVVRLAFLQVQ